MSRTPSLPTAVAAFLFWLAAPLAAELPPLALELVTSGLTDPVAVTHAGDDRLFITLLAGQVVIWDGQTLKAQPFLDIRDRVGAGGEQGLLSVAFHPRYAETGFLFVDYTDHHGDTVVSRFSRSAADPNRADAASEKVLLRIPQPFSNHNGGQLQFGPDGDLYVGMGDGGSANDPQCRAQNDATLLGKLLRLDVDQNVDVPPHYGIPTDNPFRGAGPPLDEVWAKGLRNPWRFSFDRLTGDLYIGDVGQGAREEIDRQPAASGGGENYGWKLMEGNLCLGSAAGCSAAVPPCGSTAYTPPILDYDHEGGRCAVIGGHVYRGSRVPALVGSYVYGDLCSGTLWAASRRTGSWAAEAFGATLPGLTSFGEDAGGELYALAGGALHPLAGPTLPNVCTAGPTALCLVGGRFQVELAWRTPQGTQGAGQAVTLTPDAGYFWFFNPANPEVFVKVRDACAPPFGRFWVFAAGLTNVEVRLTVIDTLAGTARVYDNPLGTTFEAVQDTDAFATCEAGPPPAAE